MFDIIYYYDDGSESVETLLKGLRSKKTKDSRIKYNKIVNAIKVLKQLGFASPNCLIKKIRDDIWEIKVNEYRILFTYNDIHHCFVLLNYFVKKNKKNT